MIIHHYNLKPIEARILRAVWRGKGLPVRAQKIYDEMYADDPDGGPSASNAYASFKSALCYLRGRLKGSGVSIETVGYRKGYRLILGEH